jgi:hypothetical protein
VKEVYAINAGSVSVTRMSDIETEAFKYHEYKQHSKIRKWIEVMILN